MAHRLVEQDEIEGLAQTADECDALLLPERELPGRSIPLVGDPRSFEQALDPVRCQKVGKFVLQREILRHGQLPEQTQVLKEHAQRPAAQFAPLRYGKRPAVRSVEQDAARIVGSGPVQKTAQRRLSGSRSGFDQIILPFAECHVMQPQVRFRRLRIARKDVRQHLLQSNRLHTSSISGKAAVLRGRPLFSVSTDITNSLPARTDESARRSCRKWS